jgi:hypothetical protein
MQMKESLRYFLERTTPFGDIARLRRKKKLEKKVRKWQRNGSPLPLPSLYKQEVVIEYIKRFSSEIFIETGTHKGRMVYAVQPYVKNIYSIELDETHYRHAKRRFAGYPT